MYETAEEVERLQALSVATVPVRGEPRISAVDGHFWYRPTWMVGYAFSRERLLAARGVSAH